MKHLYLMILLVLQFGCSHTEVLKDQTPGNVEFNAWVIEADSKQLSEPMSAPYLFTAVSNETANIIFRRHVTVRFEQTTELSDITETIYPTTVKLSPENELVPSGYMTTELGTTIIVTINSIPVTSSYIMNIDASFCWQIGEEKHVFASPTTNDMELMVPRFLSQTVSAIGPFEPDIIHLIGNMYAPDGKKIFVLVQFTTP